MSEGAEHTNNQFEEETSHATVGMRASTLSAILSVIIVIAFAGVIASTGTMAYWHDRQVQASENAMACTSDGYVLRQASDYLTEQVRYAVETGDVSYIDSYYEGESGVTKRDNAVTDLKERIGDTEAYKSLLSAQEQSKDLMEYETYAMKLLVVAQDIPVSSVPDEVNSVQLSEADQALTAEEQKELARDIVYSEAYQSFKNDIYQNDISSLNELNKMLEDENDRTSRNFRMAVFATLAFSVLLLLSGAALVLMLTRGLTTPLSHFVKNLSRDECLPRGGFPEIDYVAKSYNKVYDQTKRDIGSLRAEIEAANEKYLAQVERERDEALHANNSKTVFLSNMSHDIRTPLNAITGYTELVKLPNATEEKKAEYLQHISEASQTLIGIIDGVLEMAHIESGEVSIDCEPCDLNQEFAQVASMFETACAQKGLQLKVAANMAHPSVLCDVVKFREIAMNILSNSVKYTEEGSIAITLIEEPGTNDQEVVAVASIADTGSGISPDFLPYLFDSFSRERRAGISGIQGSGLGMGIVKRYIDAMNGSIAVESKPGHGTTMTFRLPLALATLEIEPQSQAERVNLEGLNFLLAEDNELNAEIAIELLLDSGAKVSRACNGQECLQLLQDSPANTFDAVLMDMQMPVMDGLEAAAEIRKMDDANKAHIPIVAVTANAFEEDRAAAKAAGMNGFAEKPLNINELRLTLHKLIKQKA